MRLELLDLPPKVQKRVIVKLFFSLCPTAATVNTLNSSFCSHVDVPASSDVVSFRLLLAHMETIPGSGRVSADHTFLIGWSKP